MVSGVDSGVSGRSTLLFTAIEEKASRNLLSLRWLDWSAAWLWVPSLDVQLIDEASSLGEVDGVEGGESGRQCVLSYAVDEEEGEIIRIGMAGELGDCSVSPVTGSH